MVFWKMYLAAFAAWLYAISMGIGATYSSTATESMNSATSSFKPSTDQISWIGSILALGGLLGGAIAGYLSDKLGRKGVLMFSSLPFLTGWLMIAFAHSLFFILVGRFITGVCCGVVCVTVPMYLVEISVPEVRGFFGASFQLFISVGVLLVSAFGMFLGWRWLAIFGAGSPVIASLFMLFMPESPRWLIIKKKGASATDAIKFLHGSTVDADAECMRIAQSINNENNGVFVLHEMCNSTVYKPALLSLGLMFFQQFSGSNAILFYTVFIFKRAEGSIEASKANLFVALVMVFFTYMSAYFMDCIGRRKFLLASGCFMFLALSGLGSFIIVSNHFQSVKVNFGWIPLFCLMLYIAAFSMGFGPVPWLMMSEMSPMHARGVICGIGTLVSWIFVFVITKSFIGLEAAVHDYGTFYIYSGFCLLSCFYTWFFIPETKGKTFDEIARYFSSQQRIPSSEQPILCSDEDDSDNGSALGNVVTPSVFFDKQFSGVSRN